MHQALFNSHYNLTAGESDAHSLMPVTLMVERIIEIATRHANSLEVGYEQLKNAGVGWVLSRMSLVVDRFPAINEDYALNTWIESYNRHFSERGFEVVDGGGNIMARGRSTWVAIDMQRRTMADLTEFERDAIRSVPWATTTATPCGASTWPSTASCATATLPCCARHRPTAAAPRSARLRAATARARPPSASSGSCAARWTESF